MSAFDRLLNQIDGFIRKFYKNQIVKGVLLFTGVFFASYLFVITAEYFGRFNSVIRGSLLLGFLSANLFIITKYLIIPVLRLKSYGKRINRKQASHIIGSFFPSVSDRLLNTLQLNDQMNADSADFELLNASVQQRSSSLSVLSFSDAVDIKENLKYLKWVVPVVLLLLTIGVVSPSFISNGTERVVHFSQEFIEPAPFTFNLLSTNLVIEEGNDFNIELELEGSELPSKVYVVSKDGRFILDKVSKNRFEGVVKQLRGDIDFSFEANEFKSEKYSIKVLGKTALGKFEATLNYPAYLGKEPFIIRNANNLTVEEGTIVTWSVLTRNTSKTDFLINGVVNHFNRPGFSLTKKFTDVASCRVLLKNKQSHIVDTTSFVVDVIKDQYPTISVVEVKDSLKDGVRYFSGSVSDDYGFNSLTFIYTIKGKGKESRVSKVAVVQPKGTESLFNFAVDFRREDISLEDEIEYYFSVGDNDGVNGSKFTQSRNFKYILPSLDGLNEARAEQQEKTKDDLKDVLERASEFNKDVERLRKETLNKKNNDWNNQNEVNQLQEQQESLIEDLKSLKEEMSTSIEEKSQLSEVDKELLEQQDLINDLLEDLMDDELKDLLKQLEELMKSKNKDKIDKKMDELEISSEDMEKQLDRTLEMLKKLQVNEKIDDIEEELDRLAEKQEELKEKTQDKKDISEVDIKEQEEINKAFDELKEDLHDLDSLNNELDRPLDLDDQEEKKDEVSEDLKESKEQLDKNKGKKAGESQKSAAEKMKEISESLAAMQSQSKQKQDEEDIDMLRDILEGLISLSLSQEEILNSFKRVNSSDPAFYDYSKLQRKSIDDSHMIRDSLFALAKRQPKIAKFVDGELTQISSNHELILEDIDERRRQALSNHQQYVMTSYNNLALLLNESLADMQKEIASQKPGSGSCNKPGGTGEPSPGSGDPEQMKQMLKDQLKQMKKGASPDGKKPGESTGKDPGGMKSSGLKGLGNKEIAKMAAQQGAMRRALEKMRREMNKDGKGKGNGLNPLIKELEQQERDLTRKRLGSNLVDRQQRILTRLLESEKAMMERGLDEKRESREGFSENNGNQIKFDEYNKQKLKQVELLRSVDPAYQKYYKDKANQYFIRAL